MHEKEIDLAPDDIEGFESIRRCVSRAGYDVMIQGLEAGKEPSKAITEAFEEMAKAGSGLGKLIEDGTFRRWLEEATLSELRQMVRFTQNVLGYLRKE